MERLVFWHRWLPGNELDDAVLQRATAWVRTLPGILQARGGSVAAQAGGTLVATFDTTYVDSAVSTALELLAAQREDASGLCLTIAICTGEVAALEHGGCVGEPFDRAQSLANGTPTGSLVLDVGTQQLVAGEYLFSHEVTCPDGSTGELLDLEHPRRSDCHAALAHLHSHEEWRSHRELFHDLVELSRQPNQQRIGLAGPSGCGATHWMRALATQEQPPVWLHLLPVGGSLTPLGSLAYALKRLQRRERPSAYWLETDSERDSACEQALSAIREGRAISKGAAVGALRHFLARVGQESGTRPWLALDSVVQLDPATVRVVAEATREGRPDSLMLLRLAPGQKPPSVFARTGLDALPTLNIPPLSVQGAQDLAETLLGIGTAPSIVRKAALMGGPTPLGVLEAVRSLVSLGEIIYDDDFRWRRGPGGQAGEVTTEALFEQRLEKLDAAPRRILEALVTVPDACEGQVVEEVARMDGLSESARGTALEQLVAEGFIISTQEGFEISQLVRHVIHHLMPSARRAELFRFVGYVLESHGAADLEFRRATLGYYYAHAGRPADAVSLFIDTAHLAGKLGWARTAVRLAAAAVQTDPSNRTRLAAATLTTSLSRNAMPPILSKAPFHPGKPPMRLDKSEPPSRSDVEGLRRDDASLTQTTVQRIINALLNQDVEEVERCLELAVAAGVSENALQRLRAISLVGRGDPHAALRVLNAAHLKNGHASRTRTRTTLAEALVWLAADQVTVALRTALSALAAAREQGDQEGELAVLRTLSTCYRRLGREQDAIALATLQPAASN